MSRLPSTRAEDLEAERQALNLLIAPLGEKICAGCLRRLSLEQFSADPDRCLSCASFLASNAPKIVRKPPAARLNKAARCARNRELMAQGKRICKVCSDKPQSLNNFASFFQYGKIYYASSCLKCTAAAKARRYQTDEALREYHRVRMRRYREANREQENERLRRYRQQKAAILEKARKS